MREVVSVDSRDHLGHDYDRRETDNLRPGEQAWVYCHEHGQYELFTFGTPVERSQSERVKALMAARNHDAALVEWANTLSRAVGVDVTFTLADFETMRIGTARRAV